MTSKGIESDPASIKDAELGGNDTRLYVSENNYRNFIDCVKSRKAPIQPVETGHRTASLCHLGNIAMILKRKIKWDPANEVVIGDEEAARMISRPFRAPWRFDMPIKG